MELLRRAFEEADEATTSDFVEQGDPTDDVAIQYRRQQSLRRNRVYEATRDVLVRHGLPVHWSLVADMVRHRLAGGIEDKEVYNVLQMFSDTFRAYGDGVYGLRSGR